jgi:hypothetical protein
MPVVPAGGVMAVAFKHQGPVCSCLSAIHFYNLIF